MTWELLAISWQEFHSYVDCWDFGCTVVVINHLLGTTTRHSSFSRTSTPQVSFYQKYYLGQKFKDKWRPNTSPNQTQIYLVQCFSYSSEHICLSSSSCGISRANKSYSVRCRLIFTKNRLGGSVLEQSAVYSPNPNNSFLLQGPHILLLLCIQIQLHPMQVSFYTLAILSHFSAH